MPAPYRSLNLLTTEAPQLRPPSVATQWQDPSRAPRSTTPQGPCHSFQVWSLPWRPGTAIDMGIKHKNTNIHCRPGHSNTIEKGTYIYIYIYTSHNACWVSCTFVCDWGRLTVLVVHRIHFWGFAINNLKHLYIQQFDVRLACCLLSIDFYWRHVAECWPWLGGDYFESAAQVPIFSRQNKKANRINRIA